MKPYLVIFITSALLIFFILFLFDEKDESLVAQPSNLTNTPSGNPSRDESFTIKAERKNLGNFTLADFYDTDSMLQHFVDSIFISLSTEEKAAQLIMPATSEYNRIGIPFSQIKSAYKRHQIGGVLYLKGKKSTFKTWIAELNEIAKQDSLPPLISGCDCEPTLFHKKFTDADSLTATNFLTSDGIIKKTVGQINHQMGDMGIQLNLAPIADIGTNQEVINTRSFGTNPEQIVKRASAFVQYSQSEGIASTIKHFPGHGAIVGDSHKQSVYIYGPLTEVSTFQKIIQQSQPIAVMVGHIKIRKNKDFSDSMPATLSRDIITGLLKEKIGFKGIVITDAMQMQVVKSMRNSSFSALQAGADLIIMPVDIPTLHKQIVLALEKNNAFSDQLESSVKKIIRLKICTRRLQLNKNREFTK